jgi:hypothetical protein
MMAELLLEFSPSGYLTDTQPVPLYVDTHQCCRKYWEYLQLITAGTEFFRETWEMGH